MEEPLETFDEQNMAKEIENVDDQKQGHDDDVRAGVTEKKWPGWPGESVFRILVPAQRVGGIIGRKGESIKKVCEESRARIKILDGPQGVPERAAFNGLLSSLQTSAVSLSTILEGLLATTANHSSGSEDESNQRRVMISAKEELDASISPAMDGLLKVHKHTIDGLDKESGIAPPGKAVFTRLLVPATQAGSLIGKHGATIKSIQEASNCIVRILDDRPPVALHDDRVVEIQGEPIGLHKAVELISSHLRKFLVDRTVLQLFEMQMQAPHPHVHQITPPPQPWGPPQGLPPHSGYSGPPGYGTNPGYGANSGFGSNPGYGGLDYVANQGYGNTLFMPPARPHDNFYPPPDVPSFEKPPHHGISTYGREAPPMGGTPSNQPPPPTALQVTQHMQIPLSYADAVIGNAGASISYIRRASGATVTIQETRGVPGEMTAEITGSASQVQTAQQLIQNFMAEAAGPGQAAPPVTAQNPMGPVDQGYSSYPGHGSMYAAVPAQTGGGYGSAYGTNYGY